jgi:hypothetical protein
MRRLAVTCRHTAPPPRTSPPHIHIAHSHRRRGAPVTPNNFPLYKRIAQEILSSSDAKGGEQDVRIHANSKQYLIRLDMIQDSMGSIGFRIR